MSHIFLVIFCAALALLLFLGMIAYLITSDGKKTIKKQKTSQKQHIAEKIKNFDTDLDKMITTASDTKLSDIELKELAKLYVQTHKLGTKTSKELDEITKKKLEFVAALASNSNASVQTLAYLNKELKKISG